MLRKMSFLAVFACVLILSTPGYSQDQPSLGDVARQARKDKEKKAAQPKTVVTDDDLPSSKALGGLSDLGSSRSAGDGSAMPRALEGLDRAESALNKMDPMDRTALAKAALLDNDFDFPGRSRWEDKLYSAKQQYVSHGRELFREMRQILADVQTLRSQGEQTKVGPDDPQAKELLRRLQEIVQDAIRTENAYQSVVVEGWDLAKQAKH
jgi:hypothetical protein